MISETLIIFLTAVMHLNVHAEKAVNSKDNQQVKSHSDRNIQLTMTSNKNGGGGWDYN
jgi:hypothetical protein